MKKYLITILDPKTGSNQLLKRDEHTLDHCIDKELGGWDQLTSALTSNSLIDRSNTQRAGTTRDGKLMFSILCYKSED